MMSEQCGIDAGTNKQMMEAEQEPGRGAWYLTEVLKATYLLGKGGLEGKRLWNEGLSMDQDILDPHHPHKCITCLM